MRFILSKCVSLARVAVFAIALSATVAIEDAAADTMAFKQAIAEAAASNEVLSEFYRSADYEPVWIGEDDAHARRRTALLQALEIAGQHGLPAKRYDRAGLVAMLRAVRTDYDLGLAEIRMSEVFVRFARDIQTGILVPRKVDSGIVRDVPYRDPKSYLTGMMSASPESFIRSLPPQSGEYARLLSEKMRLEQKLAQGGWGADAPRDTLKPGQSGQNVVRLRNRLMAMGYLDRSLSDSYDATMQRAVQQFQADHGLEEDGVAGPATLGEINVPIDQRLRSVLVAMERERWINKPLGKRHILVNLTDFTAKIVDDGKVTFRTRSVIGAEQPDRRSPEFSDLMEHMVINPSWNVPRSITVKEYLPQLRKNPNAVRHLDVVDRSGRVVPRGAVNFSEYTESNFPFRMKQAPSRSNALGLVKFMFPNKYNIYLHDTPSKNLFLQESRAFSHGCIRLQQPFEFAYKLLAPQVADPKAFFQSKLNTGRETTVRLAVPVPVHIDYRTAITVPKGRINYRRDVYGRDAEIWLALSRAGVALGEVQS